MKLTDEDRSERGCLGMLIGTALGLAVWLMVCAAIFFAFVKQLFSGGNYGIPLPLLPPGVQTTCRISATSARGARQDNRGRLTMDKFKHHNGNHKHVKDQPAVCVCGHGEHEHDAHGCAWCRRHGMRCEQFWAQEDFADWAARKLDLVSENTEER